MTDGTAAAKVPAAHNLNRRPSTDERPDSTNYSGCCCETCTSLRGGPGGKVIGCASRTGAWLSLGVHVIPLSIALFLVIVNSRTYYVGESSRWLQLLQFAAKIHEGTIQASIATIALAYVRTELLGKGRVPFGAIFPAMQIKDFSTLWSSEFWATLTTRSLGRWRLIKYFVVVVFCVVLAATCGPSSAILMIPRPWHFPIGGAEFFFNATASSFSPDYLNGSMVDRNCANISTMTKLRFGTCPSSSWESVKGMTRSAEPSMLVINSIFQTNLDTAQRATSNTSAISTTDPIILAYAQEQLMLSVLKEHKTQKPPNISTTTKYKKPYVLADCAYHNFLPDMEVYFGEDFRYRLPSFTIANISDAFYANGNNTHGNFVWIDPDPMNKNLSLLAVVVPSNSTDILVDEYRESKPVALCAIKSHWIQTSVEVLRPSNALGSLHTTATSHDEILSYWKSVENRTVVTLDPLWAQYLVPLDQTPYPPMDQLLQASFADLQVHILLAGLISTGMANSVPYPMPAEFATISSTYWARPKVPTPSVADIAEQQAFGSFFSFYRIRGNARASDVVRNALSVGYPTDALTLKAYAYQVDLSYSLDGVPVKIALVVLCLYIATVMLFMCYTMVSGTSSSAWTSWSQVVALGINSERIERLKGLSTGSDCRWSLQQPVSIRARKGEGVQFVFEDSRRDLEKKRCEKIKDNETMS